MPSPDPHAAVVAYQRVRLREIRALYEELDLGLDRYLGVERRVSEEIDVLEGEFAEARQILRSLGADLPEPEPGGGIEAPTTPVAPGYRGVRTRRAHDFRDVVERAEDYLASEGVDPSRDPLLQVLGPSEAAAINGRYKDAFGDIHWTDADRLVVALAGFVATLLDVFLVRIPTDVTFLGKAQPGSPLTGWMRKNSKPVHDRYLRHLEKAAKVPYDMSIGKAVEGLRPSLHRLMSPGHDPVLGFVIGVIDVMGGTGTLIDKSGRVRRVGTTMSPDGLIAAFLKVFLHLLSDVFTSAGIQPPFFTLLQLLKARSPFVLGPSGERVSWTDVARYMYSHGYDLRHFAAMGLVPASVEMIIRGWWLCRSFEGGGNPEPARAKLASMLVLGHAMAASGNLLKTGVVFGMNPLALNWAEMLALFPATVAWMRESVRRDRAIREKLDAEWVGIYEDDLERRAWSPGQKPAPGESRRTFDRASRQEAVSTARLASPGLRGHR